MLCKIIQHCKWYEHHFWSYAYLIINNTEVMLIELYPTNMTPASKA